MLSKTRIETWRRCQREHFYKYLLRRSPITDAAALRFGILAHAGLEAWWRPEHDGDRLEAALAAIAAGSEGSNPFDRAHAEALLIGYDARWAGDEYEVIAVESRHRIPLVDPETGEESRDFEIEVVFDVIARRRSDSALIFVEHKTSSSDTGQGSRYWSRLRLDGQISTYFRAGDAVGVRYEECLYDVVGKSELRPLKATPPEKREYTKPRYKQCPLCRKKSSPPPPHEVDGVMCEDDPDGGPRRLCTDPGGRLHANQREVDETVDEYRARVLEDIAAAPDAYYQRGPVVRLEHELAEFDLELWETAQQIARPARVAPRNPDACNRYGGVCPYFDVCTGAASIDDDTRFRSPRAATPPQPERGG